MNREEALQLICLTITQYVESREKFAEERGYSKGLADGLKSKEVKCDESNSKV